MAAIDKLEQFASKSIKPGRNNIHGVPVDIADSPEGNIAMEAVDSDGARQLLKKMRSAGLSVKPSGSKGIVMKAT